MSLAFRNLLVSTIGDDCQSVACRFCLPLWLFRDLQEKYGEKNPKVIKGDSESNNLINKYLSALPESCRTSPGIFLPLWQAADVHKLLIFQADTTENSPQNVQNCLAAEDWNSTKFDVLYLNGSSVAIMQVVDGSLSASGMTRIIINNAFNRMKRDLIVVRELLKLHQCEMSKTVYVFFFAAENIKDVVLEASSLENNWIEQVFENTRFQTFYVDLLKQYQNVFLFACKNQTIGAKNMI